MTDLTRRNQIPVVHNPVSLSHNPPYEVLSGCFQPYQESPERYHRILKALLDDPQARYLEHKISLNGGEIDTDELDRAIGRVHDREYLDFLREIYVEWVNEGGSKDAVLPESFLRNDVLLESSLPSNVNQSAIARTGRFSFDLSAPITADTRVAALASALVAITASRILADDSTLRASFALCRPPGHHATPGLCGGYCYLNNVAIAVRDYQDRCTGTSPSSLDEKPKVAILDIDYHHGNGTSKVFYNDPSVLYVSLHGSPDYPYYTGSSHERGGPQAQDLNLNFPLPLGTGDAQYVSMLQEATNAIDHFEPELVFVSLGVDTFVDDPLTQFELTLDVYPRIGETIARLGKRTVFILEGGYC
ncbi:histone deacetylase family protein [Sporobolomyces koalae]|uniref:histone deacetylase family protein n=1 Tax=Sporobolomyces koalae TaxID=500713 RepID=UPI0031729555